MTRGFYAHNDSLKAIVMKARAFQEDNVIALRLLLLRRLNGLISFMYRNNSPKNDNCVIIYTPCN